MFSCLQHMHRFFVSSTTNVTAQCQMNSLKVGLKSRAGPRTCNMRDYLNRLHLPFRGPAAVSLLWPRIVASGRDNSFFQPFSVYDLQKFLVVTNHLCGLVVVVVVHIYEVRLRLWTAATSMDSHGGMILTGDKRRAQRKPVPVPPQTPHGLTRARNRASSFWTW
jgi:hypothetical protein